MILYRIYHLVLCRTISFTKGLENPYDLGNGDIGEEKDINNREIERKKKRDLCSTKDI